MNIVLFSRVGVHYEDSDKSDTVAIYVPFRDQIRQFNDMDVVNQASIKERYGIDDDNIPLWREDGSVVNVYGSLTNDLYERRTGVEVSLAQDYAPKGNNVFYFIFGDRWIVHGVRTVNDEGIARWDVSRIDGEVLGCEETIVSSISDRLMQGVRENICVAVHGKSSVFDDLQLALESMDIEVIRFSSLTRNKDVEPIYRHRDYGLLMLTAATFTFLVLFSAIAFVGLNYIKLDQAKTEVADLNAKIRLMQMDRKLGHIKKPENVLNAISKQFSLPPSAIVHASGDLAAMFGTLKNITIYGFEAPGAQPDILPTVNQVKVKAQVGDLDADLLVDQESVAISALSSRPWIRLLERKGQVRATQQTMDLIIGVQVK